MKENITKSEKIYNFLEALKKFYMIDKKIFNINIENYFFTFILDKRNSLKFSKLNNGVGTNFKPVANDKDAFEFFEKNIKEIKKEFCNIV